MLSSSRHLQPTSCHVLFALERHLNENSLAQRRPYVIGERFTDTDMVISAWYMTRRRTRGDQKELEKYPRRKKMYNAVQSRPNVKTFLESNEYKG